MIQKCQELEMIEYIIETQEQRWLNCLEEYDDILQSVENLRKEINEIKQNMEKIVQESGTYETIY